MNKRNYFLGFLGIFLLSMTLGCKPSDTNLRTIIDTQKYIHADSTENRMKWLTDSWTDKNAKIWSSAGLIITDYENVLGSGKKTEWINTIATNSTNRFRGYILAYCDFEKMPDDWVSHPQGTFERNVSNLMYSNEEYLINDLKLSNSTIFNPKLFTESGYGDELVSLYVNRLKEVDQSFPYQDINFGLFVEFNHASYNTYDDDPSVGAWLDPFAVGVPLDSYTNNDFLLFNGLYYEIIDLINAEDNELFLVLGGDRLYHQSPEVDQLVIDGDIRGYVFPNVTPYTYNNVITFANSLRDNYEITPLSPKQSFLTVAGIQDIIYMYSPSNYINMMMSVIDAGMYFTPGTHDGNSYFKYPDDNVPNWWVRINEDEQWEDNPNLPEYASVKYSPTQLYGGAPSNLIIQPTTPDVGDTTPATINTFVVADWDSLAGDGTLRLTGVSISLSEDCDIRMRSSSNPFTLPLASFTYLTSNTSTYSGNYFTALDPFNGTLYYQLSVIDGGGNETTQIGNISITREVPSDTTPPNTPTFTLAAYDSSGVGGTIGVDITASTNEISTWEIQFSITSSSGPWTDGNISTEASNLNENVDTGISPFNGTLYSRVRATDENSNVSEWSIVDFIDIIRQPIGDITPPVLSDVLATIEYGEANGDSVYVDISATSNEIVDFVLTTEYASSFINYLDIETEYYQWKTAANGERYSSIKNSTTLDTRVGIGPRCYHTDTLRVYISAKDLNGNITNLTALDTTLDYPYGDSPIQASPSQYVIAAHHNGSITPYDDGVTIDEWAMPDLLFITSAFLYEGPHTEAFGRPLHWAKQIRDHSGSNNKAIVGFAGTELSRNPVYPWNVRQYDAMQKLYDEGDTNVFVHTWYGEVALRSSFNPTEKLMNITSETARSAMVDFIVDDWNHSENRLPYIGLMFDVYELLTDFPLSGYLDTDGNGAADDTLGVAYFGWIADLDQDGVAFVHDDGGISDGGNDINEQILFRNSRVAFLQELRSKMDATGNDKFIIGINSVTARADSLLLSQIDYLFMEDIQVPHVTGTGYETYGATCWDPNVDYFPYHRFLSDSFIREYCPGIFYYGYLAENVLPYPSNFNSSVFNIDDYMRQDIGPYILIEMEGADGKLESVPNSVYAEILGLMADNVYPSWIQWTQNWRRQWNHPSEEGYSNLSEIGTAIEPMQKEVANSVYDYWSREFTNGKVEILIKNLDNFDDKHWYYDDLGKLVTSDRDTSNVDQFEYRVIVDGQVLRQSAGWFDR